MKSPVQQRIISVVKDHLSLVSWLVQVNTAIFLHSVKVG